MKKLLFALLIICSTLVSSCSSPQPTRVLIITGQHKTHNWEVSHVILYDILKGDGYDVDIAMSPKMGEDMSNFHPDFSQYNLVVMDYNGDMWCEKMQNEFVAYVREGRGGLYLYHAANTIFTDWDEYTQITALGAFGGRGEHTEGYYVTWRDGAMVKYEGRGVVGHHGKRHDFEIVCRNMDHPAVDKSLPQITMQYHDEVYDQVKGPANVKDVLYTGYSDPETGGTGREEILIFTVDYYNARIFHSMIGHVCETRETSPAMSSETFVKTLLAGARWASGRR